MGKTFEEALTEKILRICYRLDVGLVPASNHQALLDELRVLVTKRDRIREAFRDGSKDPAYCKSKDD